MPLKKEPLSRLLFLLPRAGIPTPEAQRSFEIETANQKPFSWGIKRGRFSFVKENLPLYPSPARRREPNPFPKGK